MERFSTVQEIFRQIFDNDELIITPKTSPKDIADWDSVAHVKMVLAFEEEFGIQFTEEEIFSLKNVGDLVNAIETHKGARHETA